MYKVNYTQESFEEVLLQAYEELQPEQIKELLNESIDILKETKYENKLITGIVPSVVSNRSISFKQWKAVSAFVATHKRKNQNKTF
jgi:hypothetical protein